MILLTRQDPNFDTPDFPSPSCGNEAQGGDMFMNYMDYVDDIAMFMFTKRSGRPDAGYFGWATSID